jgi:hypothetical protein
MEQSHTERRKEERYPITAKVMVQKSNGERVPAMAANISSAGMLLRVDQPSFLRVGEEVSVEVELPDEPSQPFSVWGIARVVRIEGGDFGIHLQAGAFQTARPPEDKSHADVLEWPKSADT